MRRWPRRVQPRLVLQPHQRRRRLDRAGTDSYPVTVREVTGDDRDRVYAEQARRYPGFADYAKQTEGSRTIPVLALTQT